nr:photosystem I subunit VIII [Chenopodium album]
MASLFLYVQKNKIV